MKVSSTLFQLFHKIPEINRDRIYFNVLLLHVLRIVTFMCTLKDVISVGVLAKYFKEDCRKRLYEFSMNERARRG